MQLHSYWHCRACGYKNCLVSTIKKKTKIFDLACVLTCNEESGGCGQDFYVRQHISTSCEVSYILPGCEATDDFLKQTLIGAENE